MEKTEYGFTDFLSEVSEDYKAFASETHEAMVGNTFKCKVESKPTGFFVSYSHPKTKRSVLNLFFRKNGLHVRIYADYADKYADFINEMPADMENAVAKAPVCKRLVNPNDCNPKCVMGYDFHIRDNHYQKCRYSCFQFLVTKENLPVISDFIGRESANRLAL